MLSSAASLPPPARMEIPRPPRRACVREKNRNLFDLLLDETYPWEALNEEHQRLAIQILARLIVHTALSSEEKEKSHE
jgi:hypothetical protein